MSIDALQEKIRKRKSALIVDMTIYPGQLPEHWAGECFENGYKQYVLELLKGLKGLVPGVRFRLSAFALLGSEMLRILPELLKAAADFGYYVLLEAPELSCREMAELCAGTAASYGCDGVQIPFYAGSDVLEPFLPDCETARRDVFVTARTPNRTAPELQDLLTGSRLVHMAAADRISRYAENLTGKFGYARVGVAASAGAPESLKNLRGKYTNLFLLADGLDYPSANLKNVSLAFDRLGRGGAYCAGNMVTRAWAQADQPDPIEAAQAEVRRQNKGLQRCQNRTFVIGNRSVDWFPMTFLCARHENVLCWT